MFERDPLKVAARTDPPTPATRRDALNGRTRVLLAGLISIVAPFAAAQEPGTDRTLSVVPRPGNVRFARGAFELSGSTVIRAVDSPRVDPVAEYLQRRMKEQTGLDLRIERGLLAPDSRNQIVLTTGGGKVPLAFGDEGHSIVVQPHMISVLANPGGLFYGVQTLRQLIPIHSSEAANSGRITVPCMELTDLPRYRHRGMLLDCGRHFMDKEFIKRYIDLLAYHKLNVLHWHLTEDQGWRIEIKKHPKLTEIGAWRKATRASEQPRDSRGRYGGFYTQAEVREIVAYAAERYITVIPEIEMPGHSLAALASYPELSCTGGPFDVGTAWGVYEDVYCAGNDRTFEFLQEVLGEVIELFPSTYIHIGGDECPKTRWKACAKCQTRIKAEGLKDEHELQSYFIRRIEKFLSSKNRRLIGWDEILEGGLAPNATVQSWRGMDGAIAAASSGHDVVSSPTSHCYLDYAQVRMPGEPTFMGFVPLERVYQFEPTPEKLSIEQARHVLGLEGNIWSEHAPQALVDWRVFPRLCALAEVAWSPKEARDWADFQARMQAHYQRLDALGVTYFIPPPVIAVGDTSFGESTTLSIRLDPLAPPNCEVRYTLDGSEPMRSSPAAPWVTADAPPLTITQTTTVRCRTFLASGRSSDVATLELCRLKPHDPIATPQTTAGLAYAYHEGRWDRLPEFGALAPAARGTADAINLGVRRRDDEFGLRFEGYLRAPAEGVYTFYLVSDDGSRLWIADELVVDNDGLHPAAEATGRVLLKPGSHSILIEFFEAGGSQKLDVSWQPPGSTREAIPAAALSQPAAGAAPHDPRQHAAVMPASREREEWWMNRHEGIVQRVRRGDVDLVFIGDSITQGWEDAGRSVWERYYAKRKAVNVGISGDRTQHVLWRLERGCLDEVSPTLAVVMIGTNNSNDDDHTAEQIADGVAAIVRLLRASKPQMKILLLGVFPRGQRPDAQRDKIAAVNGALAKLTDGEAVYYLDIGGRFLQPDGTISADVMPDYLHLSTRGYEVWAEAIEEQVSKLMGER
jgi:hexosaminidase